MSLQKPNDTNFVRAVRANLVGRDSFLVVARTNRIEISLIKPDGSLKFERNIEIDKKVTDIEHMKTVRGAFRDWLVIAIEKNGGTSLRLLGFRNIKDDFIAQELALRFKGKHYTAIPNSLREEARHRLISVYTEEGDLLYFPQVGGGFFEGPHENFAKVLNPKNKSKFKFFKQPEIYPSRAFMFKEQEEIVSWDMVNCLDEDGEFAFSFITRDRSGEKYEFSNPLYKIKSYQTQLRAAWGGSFPEPVAPIELNLDFIGSILFCQTGLYYHFSPYGFDIKLKEDAKIQDDSNLSFVTNGCEGCLAYLETPGKNWDVVAVSQVGKSEDSIIIESNGDVHLMTFETCEGRQYETSITQWTYKKLGGSLPDIVQLVKLQDNVFYAISNSIKSYVFTVVENEVKIIQELHSERRTYKRKPVDLILPERKLYKHDDEIWAISRNETNSYKMKSMKVNKTAKMKNVPTDVTILDIKTIDGETLVLTKEGLMKKDEIIKPLSINHGVILDKYDLVTISGMKLSIKDDVFDLKSEPSTLQAVETKDDKVHAIVGNWDGTVDIYVDKELHSYKLSSSICSSAIVTIGDNVVYLVGSDDGEVKVINQKLNKVEQILIGKGALDFSNVFIKKIIAYNKLNVVEITFDANGEIKEKNYLKLPAETLGSSAIRYDNTGKLITFVANDKAVLNLIDSAKLSRNPIS